MRHPHLADFAAPALLALLLAALPLRARAQTTLNMGGYDPSTWNLTNSFDGSGVYYNLLVASGFSTLGGPIFGNGGFIKSGSGVLVIVGANSYAGGTTLNTGTLAAVTDTSLGTGSLTINGGTLSTAQFSTTAPNASFLDYGAARTLANAVVLNGSFTLGRLMTLSGTVSLTHDVTITSGNSNTYTSGSSAITGVISGSHSLTFAQGANPSTAIVLSGANTYTGGTTITGGLINFASLANFGSGAITLNGGGLQWAAGNTVDISSRLAALGASGATFDTNGNDVTFSSALSGAGSVTKSGAGTLTLTAPSSYAGAITLNAGTLGLGADNAIGTGTLTVNGGNLRASGSARTLSNAVVLAGDFILGRSTNLAGRITLTKNITLTSANPGGQAATTSTLSGVISGNYGLTFVDGTNPIGTIILSGANTYTGATTLQSGTLTLAHSLALQNSTFNYAGGSLGFGSLTSATFGGLAGTQNLALTNASAGGVALTVGGNNASTAYSGVLSGSGSLTKTGSGTLTLSGANTFSGGTTISGGKIAFSSADNFGSGSLAFNGGTLQWTSGSTADISSHLAALGASGATFDTNGNNVAFASALSGSGGLTKTGAGTLTLNGANTYTGDTAVSVGTLQIGAGASFADTAFTISSGAILDLDDHSVSLASMAGAGTIDLGSATLTTGGTNVSSAFTGVISGSGGLTKTGSGTLTLSGANTYAGNTTISAGTLRIGSGAGFGNTAFTIASGAVLALDDQPLSLASIAGAGAIDLGSATLTTGGLNASTTFSGVIGGTGALIKAGSGTFTLSGTNTFSGGTTISAGTLQIGDGGTTGSITGNIVDDAALVFNRTGTLAYAGALSGTGSVTQSGTGTLTLSGTNTYSGGTVLNAGTLGLGADNAIGSGTLTVNGGNLRAVGSVRTLSNAVVLAGDFTLGRSTNLAGSITLTKNITLTSANPDTAAAATSTLSGVISGSYGLTFVDGTNPIGAIILSGANTYTGATTLQSGTLTLANALALQNSTFNYAGGSLGFGSLTSATFGGLAGTQNLALTNASAGSVALTVGGNNASTTYSGVLSGSGSLTKSGSGTLTLSGANTFSGGTTISGGKIAFSSADNFGSGSLAFNGGTLQWTSGSTADISSHLAALGASGATFDTNGNNVAFASALSGSGGLTKTGAGTLTLTTANTYTGSTTVSGGTLMLAGDDRLATTGTLYLTGGGTLDLGGNSQALAALGSSSNRLAGNITAGTLTTTGDTFLQSGTYAATFTGSSATGRLWIGGSAVGTVTLNGTNDAVYTTDHNQVIIDYALFGTVKLGNAHALAAATENVQVFRGALDLNGQTDVRANSITLQNNYAQLVNNDTAHAASYAGPVALAGDYAQLGGDGDLTLSGTLSGTSFSKTGAGTLTLSNDSFFADAGVHRSVWLSYGTLSLAGATRFDFGDVNSGIVTEFTFDLGTLRFSSTGATSVSGGYYSDNYNSVDPDYAGMRFATAGQNVTIADGFFTGTALVKTDTGTLTLTDSGSGYYGYDQTFINEGTLALTQAGQLGVSALTLGHPYNGTSGTLDLGGTTQTLFSYAETNVYAGTITNGTLATDGQLYVWGDATLDATFTGSGSNARLWINAGAGDTVYLGGSNDRVFTSDHNQVIIGYSGNPTVKLLSSTALAAATENVEIWTGTLDLNGQTNVRANSLVLKSGSSSALVNNSATAASFAGGVTLSTGSAQLGGSGHLTLSGVLSGSGGLTKTGAGTLTLTGANTYTGGTTISTGTLQIGSGSTTGSLAGDVVNNAALTFSRSDALAYSGAISGSGTLTQNGTGTLTLSGVNTYTGGTTVSAGTLQFANTSALTLTGPLTVASGATAAFNVGGTGEFTSAGIASVLGSASFQTGSSLGLDTTNAAAGRFIMSGALSGSLGLTKLGNGFLTLTGANTYTGGTTVSAGGLTGTAASLQGNIVNHAAVYFDQASDGAYAGNMSGTGSLIKSYAGNLTLSGTNTYSGTTLINSGTLQAGNASALGAGTITFGGGTLQYGSGVTADFSSRFSTAASQAYKIDTHGNDVTLATALTSAGGSLTKSGAGTLTLTGANTYTGATAVNAGKLVVNGSAASSAFTVASGATLGGSGTIGALAIASGATLAPGNSPGTLSAGDTTFAGGGTFQFQLNDANGSAGTNPGWDLLSVNGTLTLSATSGNPFTLDLTSLTLADAAGNAANFNSASDYSFTFLTTTGGVSGFSSDAFAIDTTHFSNPFTGTWSVSLTNSGHDLSVHYAGASAVPEPSTYAAFAGLAALGLAAFGRGRVDSRPKSQR